MPPALALGATSPPGLDTSSYAPNFKITVNGRELSATTHGDVLEAKVVMDLEELTGFELEVNNWDDFWLRFKYSDDETFEIGSRVHVQMGYGDRLVSMVGGRITTLSPEFPESGASTLAVSGLDSMVLLRDNQPSEGDRKQYRDRADWEIAKEVAERHGLKFRGTEQGETHALVVQKNQDDAQFLKERAKRIDFDFYVQTTPEGEEFLYFVKPTDGRDAAATTVYVFEWGRNLRSFRPQLTVSRQVSEVTVRGWNSRTKEVISATATADDLDKERSNPGKSGPQVVLESLGGKKAVMVDAPVLSQEEAKRLAKSLLQERAYEFITGSGQVIGLPDLRPGQLVELRELGTRFSGNYYLSKVTHTIGANGYVTEFEGARTCDGGLRR